MTDINWNTCAFADEGCTCGRPSLAMVEQTELEKLRATVAELTAERDLSNDLLDGTAKALGLDLDNVHVHHDVPAKVAGLTAELAEVREQAKDSAYAASQARKALIKTREVLAERDAQLTKSREQAATAAKRIDGLRDYILGALDEHEPLTTEEMRNASIDLADVLADLGHLVGDEDEAPRRPVATVELPAEAVAR